jgi:hypothetical protein
MKINEIISEDAATGDTMSGNFGSVSFPMTPGTTKSSARKAVDPKGHLGLGKSNKSFKGFRQYKLDKKEK